MCWKFYKKNILFNVTINSDMFTPFEIYFFLYISYNVNLKQLNLLAIFLLFVVMTFRYIFTFSKTTNFEWKEDFT